MELFFSKFSVIDVHNHLGQGCFEMETIWHTHQWHHRLFATLIGMVVVDAFRAYQYEAGKLLDSTIVDFNTFISQLAYQQVFNDFKMHRSTRIGTPTDFRDDVATPNAHINTAVSAGRSFELNESETFAVGRPHSIVQGAQTSSRTTSLACADSKQVVTAIHCI
ncbi:hypothetical protein PHPALM_31953 [Phytophthora palmivora]|uniref:Uncharacterized protein n=1 Tax=Phytophthora palmivora TaxID=4796 RepID=A0A2P4X1A2_9STRA|nr:hypothetical protein PHPALM_31953 [Phytophthora palmivora]